MRVEGIATAENVTLNHTSATVSREAEQDISEKDSYISSADTASQGYVTYTKNGRINETKDSPLLVVGFQTLEISYEVLLSYYSGNASKSQVLESFQTQCKKWHEVLQQTAEEGEDEAELWRKSIAQVYHYFACDNSTTAINASTSHAKQLCNEIYGIGRHFAAYFDSNNYEQCKEMENLLLEEANAFAEKMTGERTDYANEYVGDGAWKHNDYLACWNKRYGEVCTLELEEKNIPKDFTMLLYRPMEYRGHFMGDVYVTIGNEKYVWKQALEKELTENSMPVSQRWRISTYSLLDALDGKRFNEVEEFWKTIRFRF